MCCVLEFFIDVYSYTVLYIVSFLFSFLHCLIMSRSITTLTTPALPGGQLKFMHNCPGLEQILWQMLGASSKKYTFPVSFSANALCIVNCPGTGKNLVSNAWGPGVSPGDDKGNNGTKHRHVTGLNRDSVVFSRLCKKLGVILK